MQAKKAEGLQSPNQKVFTSAEKPNKMQRTYQELIETPPFSNRLRHFAKDYQETLKRKITKQKNQTLSKWIFKTQMRVISDPVPSSLKEAFLQKMTLSKIKTFTKASELKLGKALELFDTKKEKIYHLLETIAQTRSQNQSLKKQLLHFDAKRNRLFFLITKKGAIDMEYRQVEAYTTKISLAVMQNDKITQQIEEKRKCLQTSLKSIQLNTEKAEQLIHELTFLTKEKSQKINELSTAKMPNHKEIVNCMFSIGILSEQLYIFQQQKRLPNKHLHDSQPRKKLHSKEQLLKQLPMKLSLLQSNRLTCIDGLNSSLLVFRVFTAIYMHCHSLFLNNIESIMKRTAYFSKEFKEIYHFNSFEKYISLLIERLKGNYSLAQQTETLLFHKNEKVRVTIAANTSYLKLINWVLHTFQPKRDLFILPVGNIEVELESMSREILDNKDTQIAENNFKDKNKCVLEITFKEESDSRSPFD